MRLCWSSLCLFSSGDGFIFISRSRLFISVGFRYYAKYFSNGIYVLFSCDISETHLQKIYSIHYLAFVNDPCELWGHVPITPKQCIAPFQQLLFQWSQKLNSHLPVPRLNLSPRTIFPGILSALGNFVLGLEPPRFWTYLWKKSSIPLILLWWYKA